jgi:beta-lactamase class A
MRIQSPSDNLFADIEAKRGGRIGVFALDGASGAILAHRADERFAMCSTFKWILCGLVLREAERGAGLLARELPIDEAALVPNSPVTRAHAGGTLSVAALCEAAICRSDNTAANRLLGLVDGPAGFTDRLRDIGDEITRLDRRETALNAATPGDPRDTTTPRAMTLLLERFIIGGALEGDSRDRLAGWMLATQNGEARLPAGTGAQWRIGHKPGTNNTNINNDVGFFRSVAEPDRAPVLISSFSDASGPLDPAADAFHAQIAEAALAAFSG